MIQNMDIGFVGKSFVQLILLVASFAVTFHNGNELPSPPPQEYSAIDATYLFPLAGPMVYEATTSYELNSTIIEKLDEATITPSSTEAPPILPTVSPTQTLNSIIALIPSSTTKPSPTPTPTTRPSATPTPTTSKPTKTPIPEATPTDEPSQITLNVPAASQSDKPSLNSDVILQLINDHRTTKKLSPLVKHGELCKLAEYRKPQLFDEIFTSGNMHKGLYDLKLPYYITENMAHYSTEQKVVSWWLGSYIHRSAIEGDYSYSCGACSGNSCAQLFTNYAPKKH